jgi:hypothetical protein
MEITITLTDKEQQFLLRMIKNEIKYEAITTIEQAIHECIVISIFDEGEHFALEESI